jgi:hypothetical protein
MVITTYDMLWTTHYEQLRLFELETCQEELLQLLVHLLSLNEPMLGQGSVQEMQQLKILEKMTVMLKKMVMLQQKQNNNKHKKQLEIWMNLNLLEGKQLLMHFAWMLICSSSSQQVLHYCLY